jgi:hypothetical protein
MFNDLVAQMILLSSLILFYAMASNFNPAWNQEPITPKLNGLDSGDGLLQAASTFTNELKGSSGNMNMLDSFLYFAAFLLLLFPFFLLFWYLLRNARNEQKLPAPVK